MVLYISYQNTQFAVQQLARELQNELTALIEEHLDQFLAEPQQIVQINASAIRAGDLDPTDQQGLMRRFWRQARTFEDVTSVYFGNTQGGVADAGREGPTGDYYIIFTEDFRRGAFYKYAVDDQGQPTELLLTLPDFDARTRPWYKKAIQEEGPVWSDIYLLFTGQDMALTASRAVYDTDHRLLGVVAVDVFLSQIEAFLHSLQIGRSGQAFIMDRNGLLVASSTRAPIFAIPPSEQTPTRLHADESEDPLIREAARTLRRQYGDYAAIAPIETASFVFEDQRFFLNTFPFQDEYGIDWLVVVLIPESDFMAPLQAGNRLSLALSALAVLLAVTLSVVLPRKLIEPIQRLSQASEALASGDWKQEVPGSRIRELDDLARAFNQMTKALAHTFARLENETRSSARIAASLKEKQERLLLMRKLDRAVLGVESPESVALVALEELRALIPFDRASVVTIDMAAREGMLIASIPEDEGPFGRSAVPLDVVREALAPLEAGLIYEIEDLETAPPTALTQGLRSLNIRSAFSTPLRVKNQLIGLLNLQFKTPRAYNDTHMQIAYEVASALAIAIHQARLHEQVRRYADEMAQRVAERTASLQARVEEVEELNRALANVMQDLKAAQRRLEQVNEELQRFAFSVSHDLRAPLRAMEGFAQALLEDYAGQLDAQGREYAQRIVASAHHMDRLIQDLLQYSRLSRMEMRLRPVNLEQIMDAALGQLASTIEERGARIHIERPLPHVLGHHAVLEQIFTNLLSNAIKFTPPAKTPRVRIWAEIRGRWARVWVEDKGIGIAPEHRTRIFHVFERLHGIEAYPGTGIGLAVVQKGVERLGGRCGVESEEGAGSRFWVELEIASTTIDKKG
ncbi:MAG: HAMP domain-containing protein [Chloroflexi bacterium]|nr:HAMP domain-containing protein [Chloroflexota bacterium]